MTGNNLRFISAPDFETPQDSGADNIYNVSVTANDGTNSSVVAAFAITVTDANDSAPVITNTNLSPSVAENTTAVTAITVTDTDSTTFNYTLGGTDSALFNMSGDTLSFATAPDFEKPQDSGADNIYNITIIANDSTNNSAAAVFAITVTDANDSAPVITNTNLAPSIAENTTTVALITVTDADSTAFGYTLGGADRDQFNMSGNTLNFVTAPDFEKPTDSGTDNIYNITITADDTTNNSEAIAFTIRVTDANDSVPVITNTNLNLNVAENTTAVTAITVTDTDSTEFTYTLGGADKALFNMEGNSLRFVAASDFEKPQDSGSDNTYNVTITASDGTNNSDAKAFAISVTNTNDSAPVITNTNLNLNVVENTTAVTLITVTDTDSTTFNYTLDGADSTLFNMSGNILNFATAPDFENPQDSGTDNIYNITITADDTTNNSETIAFTITVTDVDDLAPVITIKGANPVTLIQGDAYTDAGASATDDRDGSVGVTTSGFVDTSIIGTYTITYTATDTAGNTNTATRTVAVNFIPSAFVTTWKTFESGITGSKRILIKTFGSGYNYTIDWGDGQTDSNVTGDIIHLYSAIGTYTVSITGDFPRIIFGRNTDANKLLSIEQWGDIQWQSMSGAFSSCSNLVGNASDVPDLSQVARMDRMFSNARSFNQDISNWDVSAVINMAGMFEGATAFNQDLSNWDVSSVISMASMFNFARAFKQNLNNWDVSAVTNMSGMFESASAFNQDLSNWDVSAVINMASMFESATAFNQDLSNWDVSSVANMTNMFRSASNFNHNISTWDVATVTNMSGIFSFTSSFNQDLNGWDVAAVRDMSAMFSNALAFNQNLSGWDVSAVRDISQMFNNARTFNQNLSNWDVSTVTNMRGMFAGAREFNQNLNNWNVSSVTDMVAMFNVASTFNQNLSNWDVSSVTNMEGMFANITLSLANYDALLLGWSAQSLQNNVTFSGGDSQYSPSSQAARDTLTEAFGWTVTDGGLAQ